MARGLSAFAAIVLVVFMVAGCEREINDPLYKQAEKYEEAAFQATCKAVDEGRYTAESSAVIRDEAARTAGFASAEDARAQLKLYIESEDSAKRQVGRQVVDLGMKYNKKVDIYVDKHNKGEGSREQ